MNLDLVHGDLLDQDVEVIVNAWNRNIIPWWLLLPQGVSGAIKRRGGTGPFKELRKHGSIPLGGAVLTSAGRLPYKGIIHVAGINMFWRASEWSIRQCVRNAMALAHEMGFQSIAFPLIGAGSGGFNQDRAKAIMEDELGKMDYPMEVRVVVFRKLSESHKSSTPREPDSQEKATDQPGRRWIVRQVARRLRYQTLDELVGQIITLCTLQTTLADIQVVLDKSYPGCVFAGPEEPNRIGALAKYGLLDLRYNAPASLAATEAHRGLSLLKDLGLVWHPGEATWEIGNADTFGFVTDLLGDFDRNETLLLLFLEQRPKRTLPPPAEWEMCFRDPSLMTFPKTMEIVDACITNSASVWLDKHFYL
jgi:O-acetyl-ADP-ribose deacetylase